MFTPQLEESLRLQKNPDINFQPHVHITCYPRYPDTTPSLACPHHFNSLWSDLLVTWQKPGRNGAAAVTGPHRRQAKLDVGGHQTVYTIGQ